MTGQCAVRSAVCGARSAVCAVRSAVCAAVVVLAVLGAACGGAAEPAPLEAGREACGFCRMTVSQPEFAAQIVAPGELPRFFDDIGCLQAYLQGAAPGDEPATIFVTDRRTRAWVPIETAVLARVPALATPMGSHIVAHASAESRASDTDMAGAEPVALSDVVPAVWRARR